MYDEKVAWPKEVLESILAEVEAVGNEEADKEQEDHVYEVSVDGKSIDVTGEFIACFARNGAEGNWPTAIEGTITDHDYMNFVMNAIRHFVNVNHRIHGLFRDNKEVVIEVFEDIIG